ncbi:hypothetical protein F5X68DRAFT_274505 [Plectosphaerella plurivora]|uniref:Uncharacterized protein n=1 Tax=Plectosphaerella plurivora TaxID=936078 RepID=A0A9P8VG47_9PEZI|nr:hypothetical protein F5X68DRAFT_274505 [Plectosphaerella plurivora]
MIFDTKTAVLGLALAQWVSAQAVAPSPIFENVTSSDPSSVVVTTPAEAVLEPPVTTAQESSSAIAELSSAIEAIISSSAIVSELPTDLAASSSLFESSASVPTDLAVSSSLLESASSALALETSSAIEDANRAVNTTAVVDQATSSVIDTALAGVTETSSAIVESSSAIVESVSSALALNQTVTEASSAVAETASSALALNTTVTAIAETASSSLALNATITASSALETLSADRNLIPPFANATITQAVTEVQVSTVLQVSTVTQDLGNNITVTSVVTNQVPVTVTAPPATETVQVVSTQIIQQPTVIIVQQITFFVFQSALGAICPAVQPAPAAQVGQGGFIVGGQTFPQFQQACLAACNIQLNQCQTIVGPGIQLTQCQSQFIACQGAAATATVTVAVPTTITQTVILPPNAAQTDAPAVTSHIVEGGGQVIATTTLASDAVATIGSSGVHIITVTATPAPPAAPAPSAPPAVQEPPVQQAPPQHVTSIVTVTIDNPAQPGVPLVSTATLTLQHPVPTQAVEAQPQQPQQPPQMHTSVVTVTIGQQVGVITMTVPAAQPTHANNGGNQGNNGNSGNNGNQGNSGNGNQSACEVCQPPPAPVTVTETVSFCPPQAAATQFVTETVSAPMAVAEETQTAEAPPPPPPAEEPRKKGKHHKLESYFDRRRMKRGLPHHRH